MSDNDCADVRPEKSDPTQPPAPYMKPIPPWVRSKEALLVLAGQFGDPEDAKATLLREMRAATIQMRASFVVDEADLGHHPLADVGWRTARELKLSGVDGADAGHFMKEYRCGPHSLASDFFAVADDWKIDRVGIDWNRGEIVARKTVRFAPSKKSNRETDGEFPVVRAVSKLAFKREDVVSLCAPSKVRKTAAGRRRHPQWAAWVAELVHLVHHQGVPAGMTELQLAARIRERLAKRRILAPHDDTITETLIAVLNRLGAEK